jgi:hypothetical protein
MALPVTIPNTFASATASIPLSQLDTNFTTLANAVNGISDGSETLANASVTVLTAGTANVTTLNTSGQVVFNDAGADVDFRVEGDTDANLLFVDASTDRVGIGTNAPSKKLQVAGDILMTGTDGIGLIPSTNAGSIYISRSSFTSNVEFGGTTSNVDIGSGGGFQILLGKNECTFSGFPDTANVGQAITLAERMRIDSSGYLRLAGGGIQFNGDTAAANALDDYEEGNWTPVISDGTNNATMGGSTSGRYTKIGNLVTVTGYAVTTALGSVSGNVRITGLPITGAAGAGNYVSGCVGYAEGLNISANQVVGMYVSETNYIVLTLCDSTAGTTNLQASEWSAGGGIFIALTYRT